MLSLSKKIFIPVILSVFIFFFLIFFNLHSLNYSFKDITDSLFFEDILTDTLTMHYTIAYPNHFSIDSYTVSLPQYNKKDIISANSKIENLLYYFSHFNTLNLSKEEAYCHSLLLDYFSLQQKGASFFYFEECFSPSSGIVANYPVLMAEYTFRTKQDILDYLTLLKDTPNYFNSYFSFQKDRALHGFFLPSSSLKKTISQCETVITKEALDHNSHFLQITFQERLNTLVEKKIINQIEASKFISINNSILNQYVYLAYTSLKNNLQSLSQSYTPLQGLYRKEHGKEYYQWLLQKLIGCDLSIDEMLSKLEKDYKNNLLEFYTLQKKLSEYENYKTLISLKFPITDRDDMLLLLQSYSKNDFPTFSQFSNRAVNTTIKSIDDCMEEYLSPAFYLLPPIDDIWQNTIYINENSTPIGLDLFTTLAHEGYPGHLYQTVYYQLYANKNNVPLIRHLLNYEGYVEGWAIYSEFYSYKYATLLYPEKYQDFFSLWHQFLLCDRKLQLSILSILEIKLHYYNDSIDLAKELLMEYGITDQTSVSEIYQYILEEPGNYVKYYVSYLLFMDLKEKAETLMGSAFTDYKFHEFILNSGPGDFRNLEKHLLENFSLLNSH